MYWYIKKSIEGYFVDYESEIDAEYWEGKIGATYEDFLDGKWVLLSDEQGAYHEAHPEADVIEVLNLGKTLPQAKAQKIAQIEDYDQSEAVNSFTIGGQAMWLTVEERQQLATQINANKSIGRESMTKWFGGHEFTFPISVWEQMLVALEVYCGDALNVTESHKAAVSAMTTIEEVEAYDITQSYPERLNFDMMFAQ